MPGACFKAYCEQVCVLKLYIRINAVSNVNLNHDFLLIQSRHNSHQYIDLLLASISPAVDLM